MRKKKQIPMEKSWMQVCWRGTSILGLEMKPFDLEFSRLHSPVKIWASDRETEQYYVYSIHIKQALASSRLPVSEPARVGLSEAGLCVPVSA